MMILALLFAILMVISAEPKFSIVLHRHGDRSPVKMFPNDKNNEKWLEGIGQLTPTGMNQLHTLGVALNKRYMDDNKLLGESYSRYDTVLRSTDVDRVLMSVESVMEGLYPSGTGPVTSAGTPGLPNRIQPVPVHTIPKTEDNLLIAFESNQCKKYDELYAEQVKLLNPPLRKKHSKLFAEIEKAAGINYKLGIGMIWSVADPLKCDHIHGYPLPDGITEEMYTQFEEIASLELQALFQTDAMNR
eukprot:TRINITY_DN576556_c0_g1_i1.p1 TRINITY_DN576556_c0_g1~~TRINITY_DN576556_c0_g1_i1.p1  ORF type:complete len:245 (+),score=55.12 TRINITY_DN576556_c0_g1_i1:118-852(+)